MFLAVACILRLAATWVYCKFTHRPFTALDKPVRVHHEVNYSDGHVPFKQHSGTKTV